MNKNEAFPEGEDLLSTGKEKILLSDVEKHLLARLGSIAEFGIDALHAKFKEKGLISADDSQKP